MSTQIVLTVEQLEEVLGDDLTKEEFLSRLTSSQEKEQYKDDDMSDIQYLRFVELNPHADPHQRTMARILRGLLLKDEREEMYKLEQRERR